MNNLTSTQRSQQAQIQRDANQIVSQFCHDILGKTNVQISRDKAGHILVIQPGQSLMDMDVIECYVLGINRQDAPELTLAAQLDFDCEDGENLNINTLVVDNNFRNNGIAKIMLQHAENLATKYGCSKIFIDSYLNRTPIKGAINRSQNAMEYAAALQDDKNYFDKTLYIYTSMGYKPTGKNRTSNSVALVKDKLVYVSVANGLATKIRDVAATDESCQITMLHNFNCAEPDLDISLRQTPLRGNFKPYIFVPTYRNLTKLQQMLQAKSFGE